MLGSAHIRMMGEWSLHKGAVSRGNAGPRHETASSLRVVKRLKQSGSADLAADGVKESAQTVAG